MWQRYTEDARKVVFYAQEEAQNIGEGYLSTEHLLLGICRLHESEGAKLIVALGASAGWVQCTVRGRIGQTDRAAVQEMTLTPRAQRVIDLAYDQASSLGDDFIGTEHLLLGLIREGDGIAGRVLAELGMGLEAARTALHSIRGVPEPKGFERRTPSLCDRSMSGLIVVDLQDSFLAPIADKDKILSRAGFLIEIANLLDVPILATEQYATRMGGTNAGIANLIGTHPRIDKLCFSSFRSDEFWSAWRDTNRNQAVIVGVETHICVNQTAHDLHARGHEVFVCEDATGTRPPEAHEIALQRMRHAGAIVTHTESVAYEWLGEAKTPEFKQALEIVKRYSDL
ncbi:MAG: isochorismatase family protein [Armatimonadetes bacterium]|nr:isochorismatase family protein [Armatimonadota bacterium]